MYMELEVQCTCMYKCWFYVSKTYSFCFLLTLNCKNLKLNNYCRLQCSRIDISPSCFMYDLQGRIQDLVLGGTKFGKVIWEYHYYCLRCLWNVWCRKIKIELQVIIIIWGKETEPLFSLSVFFLLHLFFCVYLGFLGGFKGGGGGEGPFRPPLPLPVFCLMRYFCP